MNALGKQYLLAIDFGGTKVAIRLMNHSGDILDSEKQIITGMDGIEILKLVFKISDKLCQSHKEDIAAIGVSTIGIVAGDHLELVPTIKNWDKINLRAEFANFFSNTPLYIENDVKAATYGELINGALQNSKSGIYLNLGTGVAVGLTLNNQVIKGSHGAAGEIGYLLNPFTRNNDAFSNGHAPFEELTGGKGIAEQIAKISKTSMDAKTFWETQFDPNSPLADLKQKIFLNLGYQISNLCIAWDPEIITIGGGMEAQFDLFAKELNPILKTNVPFPPVLKPAYYKQNASLNGISQLILNKIAVAE